MKKRSMKKHWDNPIEHAMPDSARVPASLRIGNVTVAPATVLAPMAGVTDTVFRRFIRNASVFTTSAASDSADPEREAQSPVRPAPGAPCLEETWDSTSGGAPVSNQPGAPHLDSEMWEGDAVGLETTNEQSGCGLIMTEFTSADGLSRMRESKRKRYLTFYDDEHPISAQLFGSNPATLAEAARIVQDTGFDMVDLNLGCPAKRVVSCNGGSGLLRDLPLIAEIFKSVRAAVTIPFTVKFRLGWNDNHIICVPLADPYWNEYHELEDLPMLLRQEIEQFFSIYKDLEGKTVTIDGWHSRAEAEQEIAEARQRLLDS